MKPIKTTGYAAVNTLCRPPYIMMWSVAAQANQVRTNVANNWVPTHRDSDGWKAAMRDGVRVVKVKIETVK